MRREATQEPEYEEEYERIEISSDYHRVEMMVDIGAAGAAVPLVRLRLSAVEVLKPSCFMTANKSAFCTGFARNAENRLLPSVGSEPP